MLLQEQPDLQLRDRILHGDREAAEQLFRRVFDGVYEFTFYRVGCDRDLTENVVQDTMTTGFATLGQFEGRSSIHTWLCGIAKNKIREHRRRRRVRSIEDILDESSLEIDAILAKVESEPIPDEVLQLKETRDLVGATLSSLPTNYREVLIAKYVDELPVNEIAARAKKSPKATESLLTRARVSFARVFEFLAKRRGEDVP